MPKKMCRVQQAVLNLKLTRNSCFEYTFVLEINLDLESILHIAKLKH